MKALRMRRLGLFKFLAVFVFSLHNGHYLYGQSEPSSLIETLQIGHGSANSLIWSPHADILAVGGSDGVRLFNSQLQEIRHFSDHPRNVENLEWSPDGTLIANQGEDIVVEIRDAENGNILASLSQPNGADAVAWSPDNRYLAVSSGIAEEHQIVIWDWRLAQVGLTLKNKNSFTSLDWSPDGTKILAGSGDNHIYVWDITTGEMLAQLDNPKSQVPIVSWSPDGQKFVTTGASGNGLVVWDASTYEPVFKRRLGAHTHAIAWKPDSKQLAINSSGRRIFILNSDTGDDLETIEFEKGVFTTLSWNSKGDKLAVLDSDYFISIWDFQSGTISAILDIYTSPGLAVAAAWRPQKEEVAVVFENISAVKIFNSHDGSLIKELTIPLSPLLVSVNSNILWSSDGNRLLYTNNAGNDVYVWHLSGNQPSEPIVITDEQGLYSPQWSPDGSYLATAKAGEASNEVIVWDADSGAILNRLSIQKSGMFLWNYDSAFVVFQNEQGDWQIGDPSHSLVITTPLFSLPMGLLAIGEPNSDQILIANCEGRSQGCQVLKGNLVSGEIIPLIEDSIHFITKLTASPNGNFLAIGGDGMVHIWEMQNLELIAEAKFYQNVSVSWSSDSRRIAIISGKTVRILSLYSILSVQ